MQESFLAAISPGSYLSQEEVRLVQVARVDPAAFDILYQRYLTPVYRYLCLHTYNDEDASDLTQQVFLQALQALPKYKERQLPFAAWLFRIAHNLAVDNFRRRRQTLSWDWLPETLHPFAETDEPETVILERELEREKAVRLRLLFDKLSQDKQELLALRFAVGFTAREIAVVVGKREEAVQKQLRRILETLRQQWKEQTQ